MDFKNITGTIATIISLDISVSLVDQVRIVRRTRRIDGLSIPVQLVVTASYFSWILHGFSIGNFFLVISQSFGFVMMCILLYYIRKAKKYSNDKIDKHK